MHLRHYFMDPRPIAIFRIIAINIQYSSRTRRKEIFLSVTYHREFVSAAEIKIEL